MLDVADIVLQCFNICRCPFNHHHIHSGQFCVALLVEAMKQIEHQALCTVEDSVSVILIKSIYYCF